MKNLVQFLILFLLTFSPFVFISPTTISAQAENVKAFENSLTTTYTVQTNGDTLVQHTFSIKNLTPTHYVSRHGLRISSPNIKSVKVSDSRGEIPAEVTYTDTQTNIGITFADEVVGEGKTRQFTITYLNPDLAQIHGQVLEVAIPKQADPAQYDQIGVILSTPAAYGEPARVTPTSNYSVAYRGGQVQLTFNDLQGRGVSALFGTEQIFDLKFQYFLSNEDAQPVLLQVALPPDTPYQRLNYASIDPKPENIELDQDGNWIATFYVGGNDQQTVNVTATALLTLEPNGVVPVLGPQSFHTQSQPFWETDNREIKDLAKQHTSPEEIHDFVVSSLQYHVPESLSDLKRLGATGALASPTTAACQEFSDLFVAMARANGIPSRVVTGYAYTENSALRPLSLVTDVLHAWPEYWDAATNSWRSIDPTWENTTGGVDYFNQFDLNHIVLAINGQSSTLPYPAGSYKSVEQTEKTLDVAFGSEFPTQYPDVAVSVRPQRRLNWLPGFYELVVENRTGAAWYNAALELNADQSQIRIFGNTNLPALLPYQTVTIPVFVYNTQATWPARDQLSYSVKVGPDVIVVDHAEITNAPHFIQYLAHPYALVGLVAGFIVVALGTGSLLILRRKK